MKKFRTRDALGLIAVLLLALAFLYSATQLLEHNLRPETAPQQSVSKTVTVDGVGYFPRQDVDVFLLMGIDRTGPVTASNSYNNDGEADTVILLIFDKTAEEIAVLNINRDAMVEMPVLGVGGQQAGTAFGQLALAHTYGTGLEDSCENLRKTVSDLLGGIHIDQYVAVNMDAIALVNDAVGGVTVTVTDDFAGVLPAGEVTLLGQQAVDFVRLRKDVGDQLNVSRMNRQSVYMEGFLSALQEKLSSDSTLPVKMYESVSPYMVTDCSSTVFSSVMERYSDYTLREIVTLEGENVRGEEFMEFYLDEDALQKDVLRLFYAPKK